MLLECRGGAESTLRVSYYNLKFGTNILYLDRNSTGLRFMGHFSMFKRDIYLFKTSFLN